MRKITLPKHRESPEQVFRRQWQDKLTPEQLQIVIDRCGTFVGDVAGVRMSVTLRGGRMLDTRELRP